MIRRILELLAIAMVVIYVVHNPAGTAHALRTIGSGIGNFVTSLIG